MWSFASTVGWICNIHKCGSLETRRLSYVTDETGFDNRYVFDFVLWDVHTTLCIKAVG